MAILKSTIEMAVCKILVHPFWPFDGSVTRGLRAGPGVEQVPDANCFSFRQKRTDFLANSLHLATRHTMSAVAVQFYQLCVKQIGKLGGRKRVHKMVLPIHDDERLGVYDSGSAL